VRNHKESPENFQPNRRQFLKIAGGIGAVLLGLGVTGNVQHKSRLLRPPGGQDEFRFFSCCIRCDRCRSICPTKVIGLAHVRDGIMNARTPILEFHQGSCDFCGKCVDVCPTGALQSFDEKHVKIGVAEIQQDNCLAYDSRGCRLCVDACPYEAISLSGGYPIVDKEKCNGCGKCEQVCPALVLHGFSGKRIRGIKVQPVKGGNGK